MENSTEKLIYESNDLLFRMIFYAGCIIDEITAFTTPNTSQIPNIASPGDVVDSDYYFQHPELHSHNALNVFTYRSHEVAVLKAIVDDLIAHKSLYIESSRRLSDKLLQLDNLLDSNPESFCYIRPSSGISDLSAVTYESLLSVSQTDVQTALQVCGVRSKSTFPNEGEYVAYLEEIKMQKLADVQQQNKLLRNILNKCVKLRNTLLLAVHSKRPI